MTWEIIIKIKIITIIEIIITLTIPAITAILIVTIIVIATIVNMLTIAMFAGSLYLMMPDHRCAHSPHMSFQLILSQE